MFFVRQSTYDFLVKVCDMYFKRLMQEERAHKETRYLLFARDHELDEVRRQLQQLQRDCSKPKALRPDDV